MPVLQVGSPLTTEERIAKRKLILRDTFALTGLFVITAALAVLTYFLFNSFMRHRQELAQRWLARGEAAMKAGHPEQAIDALRSGLQYAPGQRQTEIELAEALASAGRNQEATAYFNTLHEAEPGNGLVNLELARLAAKQGNESQTIEHYQRALDGTWEGDGYQRRLSVRLELTRYMLSRKLYGRARTQLLVAAGNAPDDPDIKLEIAQLMEEAQDPQDALNLYGSLADRNPPLLAALEGAGRTALAMGRFRMAHTYLQKVVNHPDFAAQPEAAREANRDALAQTERLLELFPSSDLNIHERASRIDQAAEIARDRLKSCTQTPEQAAQLVSLTEQWQPIPTPIKRHALELDPQLAQKILRLAYDTEKETAKVCGAPTGDDALLLKIAQMEVEQQ
jgi:tetratricopeptide (TPR) repeat protein